MVASVHGDVRAQLPCKVRSEYLEIVMLIPSFADGLERTGSISSFSHVIARKFPTPSINIFFFADALLRHFSIDRPKHCVSTQWKAKKWEQGGKDTASRHRIAPNQP